MTNRQLIEFPISQFFEMLYRFSLYDTSSQQPDAFECAVSMMVSMIPSQSQYKNVLSTALQVFKRDSYQSQKHWIYDIQVFVNSKTTRSKIWTFTELFTKVYSVTSDDSTKWGPPTWTMIHYFALATTDKMSYKAFMSCLQFILPCKICRGHLVQNLGKIHIDNSNDLFKWSYYIHQSVNLDTRKAGITLEQAMRMYMAPQ